MVEIINKLLETLNLTIIESLEIMENAANKVKGSSRKIL